MIRLTPQQFEKYEHILKQFLDSPQYKEVIINHLCHTRKWHYDWGQVLRVKMLPSGKWESPTSQCWATRSTFIQVLTQPEYHISEMRKIGLGEEDFEVILKRNYDEARAIAEQLYTSQEEYIKRNTLDHFAYHKKDGYTS